MNTRNLIITTFVLCAVVIIGLAGFVFIGAPVGGYVYHKLSVAKVADGAKAKISVVKAEAKADVTVAKIKAEETVRVGLAENNADLRIANKTASDAVDAAKNAGTEVATLKTKIEKAQLEKDAAAQEQLNEAKRELQMLKEKLLRKPDVILVPTACSAPAPARVVEVIPSVPVVESVPVVAPLAGNSYHAGENPRTWQECIGNFLRTASAHGNIVDIATFQAALDGRLTPVQANFLRGMAAKHPGADCAFIEQALAYSHPR